MSNAVFSQLVVSAELAMKNSDFDTAVRDFFAAVHLKANDTYLTQQYALATYKNKLPTLAEALHKASDIIQNLYLVDDPDWETLGIGGSIHKKLWLINRKLEHLTQALDLYGSGFVQHKHYYCGENYALCLNYQASIQKDIKLQNFFNSQAKKVREEMLQILDAITAAPDFMSRPDKKWVLATLANTMFALGKTDEALFYEAFLFLEKDDVFSQWERDSYEFEKLQLMKMINNKSTKNYHYLQ